MAEGLASLAKALRLASLPLLRSALRQVQGDAQDLHRKMVHIDIVHVAEHNDSRIPAGDDSKSGAGSLLPPRMLQNAQAKLIRDAPAETVAGFSSVCRFLGSPHKVSCSALEEPISQDGGFELGHVVGRRDHSA